MGMREKLIELLNKVQDYGTKNTYEECSITVESKNNKIVADHLISNGVTIQKWIPVTERMPEPETDVLTFCGGCIDILTYRYNKWGKVCFMYRDECGYWKETFGKITHWMPLPETPNGERRTDDRETG